MFIGGEFPLKPIPLTIIQVWREIDLVPWRHNHHQRSSSSKSQTWGPAEPNSIDSLYCIQVILLNIQTMKCHVTSHYDMFKSVHLHWTHCHGACHDHKQDLHNYNTSSFSSWFILLMQTRKLISTAMTYSKLTFILTKPEATNWNKNASCKLLPLF